MNEPYTLFPPGLKRRGVGIGHLEACLCLGTYIAGLYYYPVLCEQGKKGVMHPLPPFVGNTDIIAESK